MELNKPYPIQGKNGEVAKTGLEGEVMRLIRIFRDEKSSTSKRINAVEKLIKLQDRLEREIKVLKEEQA